MNKKFALTLLSSPALFASMLSVVMMTQPARADKTVAPSANPTDCVRSPQTATPRLVCTRVRNTPAPTTKPKVNPVENSQPNEATELEFTEEESDAAIALYGCDCPACINGVRQMRGQAPMPV